jgi:regulator of protease activity HflC (stomatin/prohibitin superfamily)
LYIRYGSNPISYVKSLVDTAIKEIAGQYTATETVTKREKMVADILINAKRSVRDDQGKDIVLLQKIPMPNITMSQAYEQAVEAKQIAMQNAEKSRYDLQKIKTEADMKLATAKADAESMKIKTEALSKSQSLVSYEYVKVLEEFAKKWNGTVPQTLFMGNSGKQNLWIPINTEKK